MTDIRASPRVLALAGAIASAVLVLSACGSHPAAAVSPALALRRIGLESIFEAPQLYTDPAATLAQLQRLGVDRVRVDMSWDAIAPNPESRMRPSGFPAADPTAYPAAGWAIYDLIVRDARARGIGVDLTLDSPPPLWAAGGGAPERGGPFAWWRPSMREFGSFVRAVATRYSGSYTPPGSSAALPRVRFWSIWNEPNYGLDLAPQATHDSTIEVSPALYRQLLDAAWTALQATGHGGDTILIGELAPRGITVGDNPGNFGGMVPLRFLRALYCVDSTYRPLRGVAATARQCPTDVAGSGAFVRAHPALFRASGFSVHPYPQDLPPTVPTPDEPDYADLPQLPKLETVLDAAQQAYGSSTRFPIYSTEFGYKTNPPEAIAVAITPARAAYYLNWAEYISWRDPRVRSYDQYLLTDPPRGNFATGLEFATGAPKPSLAAYRMPIYMPVTSTSSGKSLEVWGGVRPARYAQLATGARQHVQIQFQSAGRAAWDTVRTVQLTRPHGYFDVLQRFSGAGAVRLRWSYPNGATIFSRTVVITVR